jgi:hypothetical protein
MTSNAVLADPTTRTDYKSVFVSDIVFFLRPAPRRRESQFYLCPLGFELLATLKLYRVDADALVWLPLGKRRFTRLLRPDTGCLNEMPAGGRAFAMGSLECDGPFLGFRVVGSYVDLGRVDDVQVKSLDVFLNLIGELVSSEQMG